MRLVTLFALVFCTLISDTGWTEHPDLRDGEKSLMEVDRAFSAASEQLGAAEAFFLFMAEDGIQLPHGDEPIRGPAAMKEALQGEFRLTWEPEEARLARSGELGYTWGRFAVTATDSEGRERKSFGKYVTIWEKQADGSWKFILDCGNSNPDPTSVERDASP